MQKKTEEQGRMLGEDHLPEEFLQETKRLLGSRYGEDDYRLFLQSYQEEARAGLRLNRRKLPNLSLPAGPEQEAWGLQPVPWAEGGYYYGPEKKPARHPYYYAGLYYIQEPSAMIPASILPVSPGERVLDLCAAPGGKATQLGAKLGGRGVLYANDISSSRAKGLLKNLELFGIPNMFVTSVGPDELLDVFPESFDKILIDAPCSGGGMFRREPSMVKSFQEKGPAAYVPVQKELLEKGAKMLKAGGYLVYSTCTFSEKENEGVILDFLAEHEEFEAEAPQIPGRGQNGEADMEQLGLRDGVGLREAIRVWPHCAAGEGHFAVLLHKKGEDKRSSPSHGHAHLCKRAERDSWRKELPSWAAAFFREVSDGFGSGTLLCRDNQLYLLPEGEPLHRKLRYVRTGLLLGARSRAGKFEPSQALAMALAKEEYTSTVSIPSYDSRAVKYLKGETVELDGLAARGDADWMLVCIDGFPVGWGKRSGSSLKNKYYPGWRWQ